MLTERGLDSLLTKRRVAVHNHLEGTTIEFVVLYSTRRHGQGVTGALAGGSRAPLCNRDGATAGNDRMAKFDEERGVACRLMRAMSQRPWAVIGGREDLAALVTPNPIARATCVPPHPRQKVRVRTAAASARHG